jgi:DNA-nicking Smr family endonuclease
VIKKKDLSEEDKSAWENFTKSPSDIFDKEQINKKASFRRDRFNFDLHGFTLLEANKKVKEIILSCVHKNYKEILLITGKGLHSKTDHDIYSARDLSKLKYSVPEFINNSDELSRCVISISQAAARDGGEGAILIKLKNITK